MKKINTNDLRDAVEDAVTASIHLEAAVTQVVLEKIKIGSFSVFMYRL